MAALAAGAGLLQVSRRARAAIASIGLVTCSAVLVHLSGGYIEVHFHFFVMIAVIVLYQDWLPFLIAIGYVVLEHGVGGMLIPEAVYNHPAAQEHPWQWALIHGRFVLAESVACVATWRLSELERERAVQERLARKAVEAEVEALRDLDRLKSEFISIVSHELRTPLASLVGFSELLLPCDVKEDDRRLWTATMHTEAERLSHIIDELLDVARIEEGRVELHPRRCDLGAIIDRTLATLATPNPSFRLERRPDEPLPPVLGDPNKISQVVLNLVSNAIKYSPEGGTITIATGIRDGRACLTVADQGLGISADEFPKLFGRFHRIRDRAREGIPGTGLGLYIVKQLVELHGGRVWAESPGPNRGSSFHVELPIAEQELRHAA